MRPGGHDHSAHDHRRRRRQLRHHDHPPDRHHRRHRPRRPPACRPWPAAPRAWPWPSRWSSASSRSCCCASRPSPTAFRARSARRPGWRMLVPPSLPPSTMPIRGRGLACPRWHRLSAAIAGEADGKEPHAYRPFRRPDRRSWPHAGPALPVGVPITAQSLGIMLCGTVLGARRGALAVLLFLLVAALACPFSAAAAAGIGVFVGPSVGFLIGFPIAAFVAGLVVERDRPRRRQRRPLPARFWADRRAVRLGILGMAHRCWTKPWPSCPALPRALLPAI